MPFDGTDYREPRWDDRLLRLAEFAETLEWVNLHQWEYCVLGRALNQKLFISEGFRWGPEGLPMYWPGTAPMAFGWKAVARFFGMTPAHARKLFCYRTPWDHAGPDEMARRIRAYCDMRWMAMAC